MRTPGLVALLSTTALALSACGGGADRPAAQPGSPQNPLVAKTTDSTSGSRLNEGSAATSSGDGQLGYQKLVDKQSSTPQSRFTPCNLVSQAQARAILGGPVMAPVEAPQGPTCIYRAKHGKAFVTLAVQQNVRLGALRRRLRHTQAVGISDRTGYCGIYGQPMLYVELPQGRILSVGAPCGVARRFATRAVAGLEG